LRLRGVDAPSSKTSRKIVSNHDNSAAKQQNKRKEKTQMKKLLREVMKKLFVFILAVCLLSASSYASLYSIYKDATLYGHLSQPEVGDLDAAYACGPVAVTNSFRYLENKYPRVYNNKLTGGNLAQTEADLASLMHTQNPGGTYADYLIWGTYKYIEDRVHCESDFRALYWPTWGWVNPPDPRPSWVRSGVPNWPWLYNELCIGKYIDPGPGGFGNPPIIPPVEEVVEILMTYASGSDGHYVAVTSFNFNDEQNDRNIAQSDGAKIGFIDSVTGAYTEVPIWNGTYCGYNSLYVDYGGGAWITMAVSVPEPATLFLLSLGGLALLRKRRV
jgi:hypothetical protein